MKLVPLIEPKYTLLEEMKTEMTKLDSKGGYEEDKMLKALSEVSGLDPLLHIHYVFFCELPPDILEDMLNIGFLKVTFKTNNNISTGLISGSLADFIKAIDFFTNNFNIGMRAIGNKLHSYFAKRVPELFRGKKILMLGDGTFSLKG